MARCACGRYPETGSSRCFWCTQLGALSLKIGATEAEIKTRRLAIVNMYHPDKWIRAPKDKRDYANKRMQQANDAVKALKERPLTPIPPAERKPEPDPVRPTEPPQPEKTETVKPWTYEEPSRPSSVEPTYQQPTEDTYTPLPTQQSLNRWQSPANANAWPTYNPPQPKPFPKLHKAAPWILAGFLVLAAPPLVLLWQRSAFPVSYAIVGFLVVIFVGYVLIKLVTGMWQYPLVRAVTPFLAAWVVGWLLWTQTPLGGWVLSLNRPTPQHPVVLSPKPQPAPKPKTKSTHPPLIKTPNTSKPSPGIKADANP